MENFDIVKLINDNPLSKITNKIYINKFIIKIQEEFTEDQQQLFIASFYSFLNYNSKNDYIIELDNVWKWLGFSRKDPCKVVLEKNFKQEIDYKIILPDNINIKGGNNKEQILMNINTFKKLCLKSRTDKADEIHDYFIKLEEIFYEIINEETDELKKQLQIKDMQLEKLQCDIDDKKNKDFYLYVGYNPANPKLSKIGKTKRILGRDNEHKVSNPDFIYAQTYNTKYYEELENFLIFILKNFKHNEKTKEWFDIEINILKDIVDYYFEFFDKYEGHLDIIQHHNFIKVSQLTRIKLDIISKVNIDDQVYNDYISECLDFNPDYKATVGMLVNDFEKWTKVKYPNINIRNNNGYVKVTCKNNLCEYIEKSTNCIKQSIDIISVKLNLNHSNCKGYIGFRPKTVKEIKVYESNIYDKFLKDSYIITDDSSDRIPLKDVLKIFKTWLKSSNIPISDKAFSARNNISPLLRMEIIDYIISRGSIYKSNGSFKKNRGVAGFYHLKIKNY